MVEEAPKSSLQRMAGKAADKLGDKVGDWIWQGLTTLGVGSVLATWLAKEWVCIRQPLCQVSGRLHGVLMVVSVAATAVAVMLGVRLLRAQRELRTVKAEAVIKPTERSGRLPSPPPFQKVVVEDTRLKLRWFIRRPLHEWIEWRNVLSSVTPLTVEQVLDGPFHAVDGCNAPLKLNPDFSPSGNHPPTFDEHCPTCGQHVFEAAPQKGHAYKTFAGAWQVRASAIEELQRMERNGAKLDGTAPISLENPEYWKLMLPPD